MSIILYFLISLDMCMQLELLIPDLVDESVKFQCYWLRNSPSLRLLQPEF